MANQPYLVVRLIPEAPIDGATFSTYLENLQLQVFDAYTNPPQPLSDIVYSSPLSLFSPLLFAQPSGSPANFYQTAVSSPVTAPSDYMSAGNYGKTLTFNSTAGISAGAYVFSTDQKTIPPSGIQVTEVTETTVTLNQNLPNYVPTGTVVSFVALWPNTSPLGAGGSAPSFTLNTTAPAGTADGSPASTNDLPSVLTFAKTAGVTVGMTVSPQAGVIASGTTVAEVTSTTVTISPSLLQVAGPAAVKFSLSEPYASLSLTAKSSTTTTLTIAPTAGVSVATAGVAVGMTLSPQTGLIPPGTMVTQVTDAVVTVAPALGSPLPANQAVTFTFPLSSGIVQHVAEVVSVDFFDISVVLVPMAVATAIIPLNFSTSDSSGPLPLIPEYLNLKVQATRASVTGPPQIIPVNEVFYNVQAQHDAQPDPSIYQLIPDNETSFYLALPPQPGTTPIALEIPSDGSPPPFDALYKAVASTLSFDPIAGLAGISQVAPVTLNTNAATTLPPTGSTVSTLSFNATAGIVAGMFVSGANIAQGSTVSSVAAPNVTLNKAVLGTVASGEPITFTPAAALVAALGASTANCTRIAYDIVWSYQNDLPIPPDPLESLYTDPPNPGNSSTDDSKGGTQSVLEQDRQKFEGTLNSFYSTRNATAERLAKFVAAVSAAVSCELSSVNAQAALLEFPVDPSQPFASAVESEILLQGLGGTAANAINFGVPAAFFYALGAKMDKSTTAAQRYQMATGDAIDRLLQEFDAAEDAEVILDGENFSDPALGGVITSFQAARRLVALGVSAASGSSTVILNPAAAANTPEATLVALVNAWLEATDPSGTAPPANPPPSYAQKDFAIWQQLAAANPAGFLALDLYDLTQGFVIPSFSPSTSQDAPAGSPFTFLTSPGLGVTAGMPVSGANIPATSTVTSATLQQSVTISIAVHGDVPNNTPITFKSGSSSFTAKTIGDCPSGKTLVFGPPGGGATIVAGLSVSGTNIAGSATVQTVDIITTVAISPPASGDVPPNTPITFNATTPAITAITSGDCKSGNSTLDLATPPGVSGIQPGMEVAGANIASGATVASVSPAANSVTINPAVVGDVPNATLLNFTTPLPPNTIVSTLADEIFFWLSSMATPAPTVQTLIAVSAAQWTTFFTAYPGWLPPFTQPVAPAASQPASQTKAGYTSARIRAFIRAVQKFFTVSSVATSAQPWIPGAPPTFALPANDPIGGSGLAFNSTLTTAQIDSGAALVFSGGPALAWLEQTLTSVAELTEIAKNVPPPPAAYPLPSTPSGAVGSLAFSVAEALFARGFRNAADITRLSAADFQQALTGTIAYDYANGVTGFAGLYQAAQGIAAAAPATGAGGGQGFQPINPDGQLTNCIPPPCLSPSGPAAYLQELLKLSEASTCAAPFAEPAFSRVTLGAAVTARRGPLGTLLASCANVETKLPLIDIVNECLEFMGAASANTTGTVYATAEAELAGYPLCQKGDCEPEPGCFDPEAILAAMPEHSTPATSDCANSAFVNLKADFSACDLPYSQALDVSRSYLRTLGSSRFETLRHFRKCITEFALYPVNPPSGFQSHLSRFPVGIETAIEYLGITPEEYSALFQGTPAQPCAGGQIFDTNAKAAVALGAGLYGIAAGREGEWTAEVSVLSEFLRLTCLTYCEFLELYAAVLAPVARDLDATASPYPKCEPCCLKDYRLQIAQGDAGAQQLVELAIFIRLRRKLQEHCGARYSFAELWDICSVLKLFSGDAVNQEFIRQLAAFQMLRDAFGLPLCNPANQTAGATRADRSQLLALWVGSGANSWNWAVARLLEGVEAYARGQFGSAPAVREGRLAERLDALSRLAGFNPGTADTWNSDPACTLRFAEVLAKILASGVKPGALLYLFNAEAADEAEVWFASLDADEAEAYPLDVPAHDEHHSLWALRGELLAVEVGDEEVHAWTWPGVIRELREHFGYAPPAGQEPLLSLAQHLFPGALEAAGFSVTAAQRQYRVQLTSAAPWNAPAGPLHYDAGATQLWLELPLRDEAVAAQLGRMPELNPTEQAAVSDLYFAPRADLGQLAFLFPDWQAAERELIQEPDEHRRWWHFRRHLAVAAARRKRIAAHLARHVAAHAGSGHEELHQVAALVLGRLLADENTGTPWESDGGAPPAVMWTPPAGGAVAALLALAGTGLRGDYEVEPAPASPAAGAAPAQAPAWELVWRDVRGPMEAFGHERDASNSPAPTVLPALALSLAGPPVSVQNGYASLPDGRRLGGATGFRVCWSGMLLIEREGEYAFHAGAPAPEGELPDFHRAETSQWRVTLQRGPKPVLVLNNQWPGETGQPRSVPRLRRGAYRITVEFAQPAPDLAVAHPQPQRTGFQLKYAGPDSEDRLVTLPLKHLYRDCQDATLDCGVKFLPSSSKAQAFLKGYYTGTLRDIRRTYQRAFKAVLFCAGLRLSARPEGGQSELGYMLANPAGFAGRGYYRTGTKSFSTQLANFDFDFLPITDDFHPPAVTAPDRSAPSLQRTQAMFDWWERLFDYAQVREEAARRGKHHVWLLFREAMAGNPANAAPLLDLIGAEAALAPLELRYYQDQTSSIYAVSSADLTDERWLVRVWRAQAWLGALQGHFHARQIGLARPDLWVAADPAAPVPLAAGVTQTGNANLTALVNAICLADGEPRRLRDLKHVNDGLRTRGRAALLAYLCAQNRVALPFQPGAFATAPEDIADLLLLDVQTGLCETASRIDEAITAVQSFIRRARLTLERPGWNVSRDFARLWDSRFASFRVWERAKRRELYAENWIEWEEIGSARRIEAFRFLENELRGATLSLAAPGGTDWWVDEDTPLEFVPKLLQRREPSELQPLTPPPGAVTREGLGTLGSPEQAGAPSWLAAVPPAAVPPAAAPAAAAAPSPPPAASSGASGAAQAAAAAAGATPSLPLWMQAAAELGTAFLRIAAAGLPPAALPFAPRPEDGKGRCCSECHEVHPELMDEYYFWLAPAEIYTYTDDTDQQTQGDASFSGSHQFGFQDSFYDQIQQQSAEWDDEDQVPQLLAKWQPEPAVRLAWCRVHNGQFGQPRKSERALQVADAPAASDLVFLGRVADSLYFAVSNPAAAPTGYTDKSAPGFRYDLVSDCAVALPEVLPAPAVPVTYPGGLPAYPFYAYHDPGAPLFPRDWFAPALAVADALRAHCGFELALKWYGRAFNPLRNDCTWMDCTEAETGTAGAPASVAVGVQGGGASVAGAGTAGSGQTESGGTTSVVVEVEGGTSSVTASAAAPAARQLAAVPPAQSVGGAPGGACCDSACVTGEVARQRALTLRFCETLLEWGDAMMRHRPAPEAFQQARLLFATAARITGRRPHNVMLQPPAAAQPVASFTPAYAPLNPRLLDLYARVEDRLGMLDACLDARRLRNGECDLAYFGNNPLREGWRSAMTCADEMEWCHLPSPYRFVFLIQKATELAGRVRELGAALLAAYEKGDAEYLASLRAGQERELLALGLSIRQDQWRDADWQVQALQQTKDVSQTNLIYYTGLYQNGLLNDEIQNISLATNAMQMRTSANITEAFGEAMKVIPDIFVGFCSTDSQVPIGTKLAGVFETIAKVMLTVADVQAETAAIDLTEAGWQRRSVDWFHQTQILPIEIQQVELQILGAQRRRDQAMQELNNQQRQIENAAEVLDFLRNKFTAAELYLWLQKETAALYRQMYELAYRTALQAQHAFNLERGHTTRRFLPDWAWDDLHSGLLAGERLESALHHMEMAYLNENVREYELTKHISLRLQFPMAFLRLRATGRCEIDIPEWMFDLDYPGHYMRRIRNVTLTIPCVIGAYTGVHCQLTLLSSVTRIDPRLAAPVHDCCCATKPCSCGSGKDEAASYRLRPDDPRMVKIFGARDAVATSGGQNDSGLFELSFSDPRYLPFEFMGAVSRWRLELPPENNYFDPNTLTDTVLHLNYTAREGGDLLRRAASAAAADKLPGDGWSFFDLRHDFPDAWELFHRPVASDGGRRDLALQLRRKYFPYLPHNPPLRVTRLMLLFETANLSERPPEAASCCCPEREAFGAHVVTFHAGMVEAGKSRAGGAGGSLVCRAAAEWPRLYSGMIDVEVVPFGSGRDSCELCFGFPEQIGEIVHAYLFCRYEPVSKCAQATSRDHDKELKRSPNRLKR